MPDLGINPFDWMFPLIQLVTGVLAYPKRRSLQLLLLVMSAALLGWWCLLHAEFWIDARLIQQYESLPQPLTQLQIEAYNTDAASKAFMVLFGFPISMFASLLSVGVATVARNLIRSTQRKLTAH